MNFSQLQLLDAIDRIRSITTAAETIGMTQSAASHALANLEAELGVCLVERGRGGVSVTEAGKRILLHAREILRRVENIRQEAAAARGLSVGKVRIGTFPSISAQILPGALRDFKTQYPNIEVVLFEGTDNEVLEWIVNGVVDAGFTTQMAQGVESIEVARDEMFVVLPDHHSLIDRRSLQLTDLASECFIMPKSGCEALIRPLFQQAKVPLVVQYEVSDVNTMLAMVKEGLGITIVPAMCLPQTFRGAAVIPLAPAFYRCLSLSVRSYAATSPAVRTFIEHIGNWVKENTAAA